MFINQFFLLCSTPRRRSRESNRSHTIVLPRLGVGSAPSLSHGSACVVRLDQNRHLSSSRTRFAYVCLAARSRSSASRAALGRLIVFKLLLRQAHAQRQRQRRGDRRATGPRGRARDPWPRTRSPARAAESLADPADMSTTAVSISALRSSRRLDAPSRRRRSRDGVDGARGRARPASRRPRRARERDAATKGRARDGDSHARWRGDDDEIDATVVVVGDLTSELRARARQSDASWVRASWVSACAKSRRAVPLIGFSCADAGDAPTTASERRDDDAWTVVETKRAKKPKKQTSVRAFAMPLGMIEPPRTPVVLVLCGPSGAGKSTFSEALPSERWVVSNQDTVSNGKRGTRQQCVRVAKRALSARETRGDR